MSSAPMPPFTGELRRDASFYKVSWMKDGYPGQKTGDDVYAHPIYGAYAIRDYLEQLRKSPSEELRDALKSVTDAVLARMEPFGDGLVFWYEASSKTARAVGRHYSGLTQGYYATYLARAGELLGDPQLTDAAEQVFRSLLIPVERGGVLSQGLDGPRFEELPQVPASHVLNGWQSILAAILGYAAATGSGEARELVHDSAQELVRLLPAYDAPALKNSRYALSGFVYARIIFRNAGTPVEVQNIQLEVPGEENVPIEKIGGQRWESHVLAKDLHGVRDPGSTGFVPNGNQLRFNLVLSRASFPRPNRLRFEVLSAGTTAEIQLQQGSYDPLASSPANGQWVTVARSGCPDGRALVDVALPWDVADLVAYPTNFAKRINGNQTNVYHGSHTNRCRELGMALGIRELTDWADTWHRYVAGWGDMAVYDGLYVRGSHGSVPVAEARRPVPVSLAESIDDPRHAAEADR